ncbi:MAG: NAD(+)/NADH kinase [Patescibacteria group bacterium]
MKKIAIYGGSLNPPRPTHRTIAELMAREFDEVIIVPCGPRPDKPTVNDIDPFHRAVMADMAFANLPKVRVELFDLENGTFTRTHKLDEIFKGRGEVWHVVGTDLVNGGNKGQSFIQREWENGAEVWQNLNFAIVRRHGAKVADHDLPPNRKIFRTSFTGSSSEVRERVFAHKPIEGLVDRKIEDYIQRYGLYRGAVVGSRTKLVLDEIRPIILVDDRNPKAEEFARLSGLKNSDDPNLIVVVGGDGFMLHAIRSHWRKRLPFFGINYGTYGFLLNNPESPSVRELLYGKLNVDINQMPLLYADITGISGTKRGALAFNDVWVRLDSGQSAWVELEIDGIKRISRLEGDGILAATSAGSTAYAKSAGATPILDAGARTITLVGLHVFQPNWKHAQISLDSEVVWRNLNPRKRPVKCFVDGRDLGNVLEVKIRKSRIASVELATPPDRAEKIMSSQFPN